LSRKTLIQDHNNLLGLNSCQSLLKFKTPYRQVFGGDRWKYHFTTIADIILFIIIRRLYGA